MNALQRKLTKMGACTNAIEWCGQFTGCNQIQQAWDACKRSDWMLWLLVNTNHNNRNLQMIACDCAESVLPNYESAYPDDDRPRKAIQAARDYVNDKITTEELQAARSAAWSAARSAAWSAELAAKSAESAARSVQADIIRKYIPTIG